MYLTPNSPVEVLGSFLRFTYVENPGIAFGIRVGGFLPVISVLSAVASILIVYFLYIERNSHLLMRFGLVLILGGALGNLVDRFLMLVHPSSWNGVVDFIDMGFGGYRWYVFNIADSAVTIGIALYILHLLLKVRTQRVDQSFYNHQ